MNLPNGWPTYYERASGVEITDLDGRTFLDFCGAGVGAAVLGWADPDVDAAVIGAIRRGSTSALAAPEEVELARTLTALHPWAGACRFTRSGGEAMAVAIRIARARTGNDNVITFNSYHGWHVNNPLSGESYVPYVVDGGVAAVVIEPARFEDPTDPEYFEGMLGYARSVGALLIMDEISTGFRRNLGGAHLLFKAQPDIAVFAKAMANGYPMGAVVMAPEVAEACERTFISSTAWSERTGPVAANTTIHKLWAKDVFEHTAYIGDLFRAAITYEAKLAGVDVNVRGHSQMLHVEFPTPEMQTLYTQLMLDRGFLAGRDFYPTYAHKIDHCEEFAYALRQIMPKLHDLGLLRGPAVDTGTRR